MRFMVMHKVDASMEAGEAPRSDIVENMGKLIQGSLKEGVFENGAGLHRSAQRVRLELRSGQRTVTKGPLTGKNELVASFAMVRARTIDGAIAIAERYAKIWGDGEIEIGPVVEPWDIGLMPKPEVVEHGRFLLLRKTSPDLERGVVTKPAEREALEALEKELKKEGALLAADVLARSARASRFASGPKGKRTWTDGPFAESKELVAGFSILNLPSKEAARSWAERYAAILDGNEVDLREIEGASSSAE